MVRLFYKDMKAHESAYRNIRADEAVNDLLLGAKLSTLNSLEDANNKSVNDVADNFGKFLKALGTKEVPLFDRLNKAEERLFKALEAKTGIPTESSSNVRAEDDKRKINEAIQGANASKNIQTVISNVKRALSGQADTRDQNVNPLVQELVRVMSNKGFNTSNSTRGGKKTATIEAIKEALQSM